MICLSETFLNSSLDSEDDRLKIRSDHPSGSKKKKKKRKDAFVFTIRSIFLSLEGMSSVLSVIV